MPGMSAITAFPHPGEIAVSEREGVVTLRGTVGSPHERQAAAHIAKAVSGVRSVNDELAVDPRDRWKDAEIRGAALRALMATPDLAEHIEVSVADGWLTLKGHVKHQTASNAAFDAASGLPGVGGITNEIKVVATPLA